VIGRLLGDHVLVVPRDDPRRDGIARWLAAEVGARPSAVLGEIRVPLGTEQLASFTERFAGTRFQVRAPNLEDLFLRLAEPADQESDGEDQDAAEARATTRPRGGIQ
jgi:hypothetical protein